jgi:hypothetical protein
MKDFNHTNKYKIHTNISEKFHTWHDGIHYPNGMSWSVAETNAQSAMQRWRPESRGPKQETHQAADIESGDPSYK